MAQADTMNAWRYVDEFRAVTPGEWFRILPVGEFRRFGRQVTITPDMVQEMASHFGVIPDTKLPVNLEHSDVNGRVGTLSAVRPSEDGLYAQVDWTEKGRRLQQEEAFGYYSPEILWRTDYNDQIVNNVLVGLALTNSPYFGSETAIFSLSDLGATTEPGAHGDVDSDHYHMEEDMTETDVKKGMLEALGEFFSGPKPSPLPSPAPDKAVVKVEETEEYKALQARLNEAEEKRLEVEKAQAFNARRETFRAIVGEDFKVDGEDGADLFAAIAESHPDEAEKLAQQVKALTAQVEEAGLFSEAGTDTPETGSDAEKFYALVDKYIADGKEEAEAVQIAKDERPDLFMATRH